MAGHSKWANIKHRKGRQDAKKAKVFARIIKELTIAARDGGDDPTGNPALRLAIQKAKAANLAKDTLERAISKGAGGEGADLQEVTYEGYGPNGIAVFVECTTDNINRTVANVRAAFTKYNGTLGTNGSLSFLFDRKGVFVLSIGEKDEEELMLELIDGGAEDIESNEGFMTLYTSFEDFGKMQKKLEDLEIEPESAELQRIPNNYTSLELEEAQKVMRLIEALEDVDDSQAVYHNMEMSDELLAVLE